MLQYNNRLNQNLNRFIIKINGDKHAWRLNMSIDQVRSIIILIIVVFLYKNKHSDGQPIMSKLRTISFLMFRVKSCTVVLQEMELQPQVGHKIMIFGKF